MIVKVIIYALELHANISTTRCTIREGIIITYERSMIASSHLEVLIPEPDGPVCFCRLRFNAQ
jgi:hypothetical protein